MTHETPPQPEPWTGSGRTLAQWIVAPSPLDPVAAIALIVGAEREAAARLPVSGESDDYQRAITAPATLATKHVQTPEGPDDYCMFDGELWPCSFEQGRRAIEEEARTVNPEGRSTDEDGLRAAAIVLEKVAVPPDALMNPDFDGPGENAHRNLYDWWHGRFAPALRDLRSALTTSSPGSDDLGAAAWCVECGESWPCQATVTRRKDGIPHRAAIGRSTPSSSPRTPTDGAEG